MAAGAQLVCMRLGLSVGGINASWDQMTELRTEESDGYMSTKSLSLRRLSEDRR